MLQQDSLSASMYSFFDRIHDYSITDDEYFELAWSPRGNDQGWTAQYVPDLEQAALRAIALGTAYDVCIWVRERSDAGANGSDRSQLLVLWRYRARRQTDHYALPGTDVSCLRCSRDGQYSLVIQHFPDGDGTREAVRFGWRSRPYKPVRFRITRALSPAPDDRQGGSR